MLKSLRFNLLLWLLLFSIGTALVLIPAGNYYYGKRERLADSMAEIYHLNNLILKDFRTQQDFLRYESSNANYFVSGKSNYLSEHQSLVKLIAAKVKLVQLHSKQLQLATQLSQLENDLGQHFQIFSQLQEQVWMRGYKDYGTEGTMRSFAHKLEQLAGLNRSLILSLRRHEKDYIMRNEPTYIKLFNEKIEKLKEVIKQSPTLINDSALFFSRKYHEEFEKLVELDRICGIKDRSGLFDKLNNKSTAIETDIAALIQDGTTRKSQELRKLELYYCLSILLILALSIFVSLYISTNITTPLLNLTINISGYIRNNFKDNAQLTLRTKQREIQALVASFSILKDEITSHINDLNNKVTERTQEIIEQKQQIEEQNKLMVIQRDVANRQRDQIAKKNRQIIQKEQLLIKEKAFSDSIISNANDGIVVIDVNGNFIESNKAFREMLKYTQLDLESLNYMDILPPKWKRNEIRILKRLIQGERIAPFEKEYLRKDGVRIPVEVSAAAITDADEPVSKLMAIVSNISQRKKNERELDEYRHNLELLVEKRTSDLKDAKDKAEQADTLKTAFLANMSHEIRTPINAILGFSELLANEEMPIETRNTYINYITNSGNNLLNLINDIIDLAKIEAGQIRINKSDCNIKQTLGELHTAFNNQRINQGIDIEIKMEIQLSEDYMTIDTDPNRFRQVLTNLISNALKFTSKGHIAFGCAAPSKGFLNFYVKDTGIGIPKNKLDYIFHRFGQVDHGNNSPYGGTGLGLAISKHLVGLLGGSLWVESVEGKGSTFWFSLPFAPTNPKPKLTNTQNPEQVAWANKCILVAEDAEMNYLVLSHMLRYTQVTLLRAKNGKEAIELYMEKKSMIDLILMDMRMPLMDGYQATSAIKEISPWIPIVAQTASAMAEEKDKTIVAGCDAYISKPYRKDELISILQNYLN